MPETVQHCPLCGASASRLFDQRTFRKHPVTNRICARCGLVYQSPRMTESELDDFYTREYRTLYQGDEGPRRRDLVIQRGRAESLLHISRPHLGETRRHLDIGASAGVLALRFQAHLKGAAVGIEPGQAYRVYAQSQGLAVYPTLEALEAENPEAFDLVSMAHVLEHLPNPVEYLAHLRKTLMAPNGLLLIEVPNLYAHNSFEVAHMAAFSAHTLEEALHKAGFAVELLVQHGQPRSVVLPLYLTLLARPQKTPGNPEDYTVRPERRVILKRQLGFARRRLLQRLFPALAWVPTP
jgi:2-polyprenyl-3-methyl-5-hydroxy-6-metoxy-1,4-benzoquinol methylase